MPLPTNIKDVIPLLGLIPHPEGGYFVETFRSGNAPMSTMGESGCDCEERDFVATNGRASNKDDGDSRRNCLTSIFWAPTTQSPRLVVATNVSDHVHYYQGGRPFKYCLYDPVSGDYSEHILGPELHKGHTLQLAVRGGVWKCGMMLLDDPEPTTNAYDYSLIGEGVGPGWDAADFAFVTEEMIRKEFANQNEQLLKHFLFFVHEMSSQLKLDGKMGVYYQEFIKNSRDSLLAVA